MEVVDSVFEESVVGIVNGGPDRGAPSGAGDLPANASTGLSIVS
jgi:hypothetical protein